MSSSLQIDTETGLAQESTVVSLSEESRQQLLIDYCALGGLLTEDDGSFRRMTTDELAQELGLSRMTLHRLKNRIKNFDEKVRKRRQVLSKKSRASKVYNGLYLKACKGTAAEVKLWAEIFDGYQPAAQKHEVKVSGLGDLVSMARGKNIIDGEVVES